MKYYWHWTTGSIRNQYFAGAWRRRGHPEDGQVEPGGPFGSVLGSRSVLDAVVEEEMSEDDEDSIAVIADPESVQDGQNGRATAIIVHSRSSSSSNQSSSSFKNLDVWQWYSQISIFYRLISINEEKFKKPYQQSLLKDINYIEIKLILN